MSCLTVPCLCMSAKGKFGNAFADIGEANRGGRCGTVSVGMSLPIKAARVTEVDNRAERISRKF